MVSTGLASTARGRLRFSGTVLLLYHNVVKLVNYYVAFTGLNLAALLFASATMIY